MEVAQAPHRVANLPGCPIHKRPFRLTFVWLPHDYPILSAEAAKYLRANAGITSHCLTGRGAASALLPAPAARARRRRVEKTRRCTQQCVRHGGNCQVILAWGLSRRNYINFEILGERNTALHLLLKRSCKKAGVAPHLGMPCFDAAPLAGSPVSRVNVTP